MSQNVQFGISKFPGIWTLALSDIVPLKILNFQRVSTFYYIVIETRYLKFETSETSTILPFLLLGTQAEAKSTQYTAHEVECGKSV